MDRYDNDFEKAALVWESSRVKPLPALAALLPYANGRVVLDAGCGNGRNTKVLLNYFDEVHGCDLSTTLLEFAKKRLGKEVELKEANITNLPYRDSSFDCVFSFAVFHHLDNKKNRIAAFKEAYRVLKKGGFFLMNVRSKYESKAVGKKVIYTHWLGFRVYNYLYGETELKNLAKTAGFKVVKCFWEKNGREFTKKGSSNLCCVFQKAKN